METPNRDRGTTGRRLARLGGAAAVAGVAGLALSGCATFIAVPQIGAKTEHVVRYDRAARSGDRLLIAYTVDRAARLDHEGPTRAARWSAVDLKTVHFEPFDRTPPTVTLTVEAGPLPAPGPEPWCDVPVFELPVGLDPAAAAAHVRVMAGAHPLSLQVTPQGPPRRRWGPRSRRHWPAALCGRLAALSSGPGPRGHPEAGARRAGRGRRGHHRGAAAGALPPRGGPDALRGGTAQVHAPS